MSAFDDAPPQLVPDCCIRLAGFLHAYALPRVVDSSKTSFQRAFKSSGQHAKTTALIRKTDENRVGLCCTLTGAKGSFNGSDTVRAADAYLPCIRSILLSCEVQPDTAMLDEKLEFQWQSSLEKTKTRTSEALMFEVAMAVACKALGHVTVGVNESVNGVYEKACSEFKTAAGVFAFLADSHLPQWVSLGSSVQIIDLPCETVAPCCEGFRELFLAHAQQMAIAKHMTGDKINFSILAKLTLGTSEMFQYFVTHTRTNASTHYCRFEQPFLEYLTFHVNLQKGLSNYFLARNVWDKAEDYGDAIAMMKEAQKSLATRSSITSPGLPEIDSRSSSLRNIVPEINAMRNHVSQLLASWTKDNSTIYFCKVPDRIPEALRLEQGVKMMKPTQYSFSEDCEPVKLGPADQKTAGQGDLPPPTAPSAPPPIAGLRERSDSDLARELQAKLNAGEDI